MPAEAQGGVEEEESEEHLKAALLKQWRGRSGGESRSRERRRSGGEGRQIPTIGEHWRSSEEPPWRALAPHLPDFTQPPPGYGTPLSLPLPYPSLAPPYPAPAAPSRQEVLQAIVGAQLGEVVQALLAAAPAPRRRSLSPRHLRTRQVKKRARSSERTRKDKKNEKDEVKKKKGKIIGKKSSTKVQARCKERRVKKRSRSREERVEVQGRSKEGMVEVRRRSRELRVVVRSRSGEGKELLRRRSRDGRVEGPNKSKEVRVEGWSKSKEGKMEERGRKRRAESEERRPGKVRREGMARDVEEGSRPSKDPARVPGPNTRQVELFNREPWRGEVGAAAVVRHLIDSDSGLLELRSGRERGAVLFHRDQVRG